MNNSRLLSLLLAPLASCLLLGAAASQPLIELTVRDVIPLGEANVHAVMLVSKEGTVLPVFVEEPAAVAIAFRLAHQPSPHALAEDLLDDLVARMGGKVTEIRLADVQNHLDDSRVMIRQGKRTLSVPARPSDSIAMALSSGAKIFATQSLLSTVGITREEIETLREELGIGGAGPDPHVAPKAVPDTEIDL
ncbi:MAG: bifunctional nuclease family protein [Myxococcota bacterium]